MSEYRILESVGQLDFTKYMYECRDGRSVGLVTAVAVDPDRLSVDGVLMVAYADREAVEATIDTGIATYWSRSREGLWIKGETSGNTQLARRLYFDCDADAVMYAVKSQGPACHTGAETCFTIGATK